MRHPKSLFLVCMMVLVTVVVPKSWSLDSDQEAEYQKAQVLLKEGKLEDALSIFTKLAKDNPSDLRVRLGVIDTTIEQAGVLKTNKNPDWERKVYQAFGDLKNLYISNRSSPEIYLSFAKCYWVNDRLQKAEKSLQKAFYFRPNYTEAYIFKGEMYLEEAKKIGIGMQVMEGEAGRTEAKKSFEDYKTKAKKSFEQALSISSDLDNETKANVYLNLGDVYHHLYNQRDQAREQWNNAVSLSQEGFWGKKAQERLDTLK